MALEIEGCKASEEYLGGVLYFTTEDKSGSLRTLSRSVTLRVLSIPRWALGDRVMLCLKASHSEIPEIYLGTRKPELYENESRSLMTTAPRLVG